MNRSRTTKALVVLLASVAALAAMASPAPAATTNVTWAVSSGHIVTHWDGATRAFPTTTGCAPASSPTFTAHYDDVAGTSHVTNGTAYAGLGAWDWTVLGVPFQVEVTGDTTTTTGTYTAGPNGTVTQNIDLKMTVRPCGGGNVVCVFNVEGHLTGTNYTGGAIPTTGNTVTLVGSSNPITVQIGCNTLLRSLIVGSTMTLTWNLTAL